MVGRPRVAIRLGNPSSEVSSGSIPSIKPGDAARRIWWRGVLEKEMLLVLMADRGVVSCDGEAAPFRWTDRFAHYDFRPQYVVTRADGVPRIVALNWGSDVLAYGLVEVLSHVKTAARREGYGGIELWTDVQIRRHGLLSDASLLYGAANDRGDTPLIESLRVAAHRAGGKVTVGELRRAVGFHDDALRAVARLIWDGELARCDPTQPIDDSATVVARSRCA